MGLHLQNSGLQALSCAGKKSGYYDLQHDLVFALLQDLRRLQKIAVMQMLAWLSVAMISSCPWLMSRRAEAIAASGNLSARDGSGVCGTSEVYGVRDSHFCVINSSSSNVDPVIADLL